MKSARNVVKPAPGFSRHVLSWGWCDEKLPRVAFAHGADPDTIEGLFAVATQAANEISLTLARREVESEKLLTHEQRIVFATVYTKLFSVAFDAALAELVQEDTREAGND